jgi:hypothetical protein
MTVTATANKYRYQGNGVTDTFAFPARVYSTDDLVIEIITRATDALEETLVLTTDYTVTIASNGTASVQVTNGAKIPDNTQDILIYRELENEQTLSLPTGTVFPAKSVETQLDRAVSQIQDLKEIVDRSIKIPVQSSLLSLEIESLPEAGKSLKWNATEDGLINSTNDPDTVIADATAQAVIATTQAGIATTAANNAAADAIATAADRIQTGIDAAAAAQSALDAQVAKMEWQGAWSAGTYQINDVVENNGSSWIATAVTTEEPSISATDWDLVALKGTDGIGLTDGDKGDITVSSGGTVWSLNDSSTARSNLGLGALAEGDDASDVPYDNTLSGLTATDVQAAIDELAGTPAPTGGLINTLYYTCPSQTVTISNASPAVFTYPNSGRNRPQNGCPVRLTTTGTLPPNFSTGVTYWVVNSTGVTSNLAATKGGAAINAGGSGSGTHTIANAPYEKGINSPSFVKAKVVGGSGGHGAGTASPGGAGGGGAEKAVLASDLSASETVTSGGAGFGNTNAGTSSFGSHCSATGGESANTGQTLGGTGTGGDINITGSGGRNIASGNRVGGVSAFGLSSGASNSVNADTNGDVGIVIIEEHA